MKPVCVITGGSGGIGLEAAKMFQGHTVVIADINEQALAAGKEELTALGIDTVTAICDVSKKEQTDALAAKAAELGTITGVVHTAGVSGSVSNPDLVMKIDLIGSEYIIESFLPYMGAGSSMVLIASMMADTVPLNQDYTNLMLNCQDADFLDNIRPFLQGDANLAYNFAKRGVRLLAEKWAGAFGEKGARINSLSPGIIETKMALQAAADHPEQMEMMSKATPLKRNGKPEDIASVVAFLCSDASAFITGTDILVDGGLIKTMMAKNRK